MPSINNPATATVKVISADKGIKFYNPQTRQIEEVVSGQEIPANAVLEFNQQGELELSFDGQSVVIQGASGTEQSVAKNLGLGSKDSQGETADAQPATYQPLPSLQRNSELSKADYKPARSGGFTQPVIERTSTTEEVTAYDPVVDDIRRPDAETHSTAITAIYVEPEEETKSTEDKLTSGLNAPVETSSQPAVIATQYKPAAPQITGIDPDTGASDIDLVTNSTEFDITGTGHSGTTIELLLDGTVIQSNIPVSGNGDWKHHWQAPKGTDDQSFNFTSRAVREGATSDPSDPVLILVKTSQPELKLDNKSVFTADNVNFAISGKTGGFNKVTLKFNELELSTNAEGDGTFKFELSINDRDTKNQFTPDFDTKIASCNYQIIVEDTAGNTATSDNQLLFPFTPFNISIDPDSGYINDDLVTNSKAVAIHGDSVVGRKVNVQINNLPAVKLQPDPETGHWQTDALTLESDGKYDIKTWHGDQQSTPQTTTTTSLEIDTTKPEFDDENFLAQPVFSNAVPPTLAVETKAGNRVTAELLDSDGQIVSKATGQAASTASLAFDQEIAEGIYTLKVTLTDPVGNEQTREQQWHADFTKPDASTIELIIDDSQIVDGTNYVQSDVTVRVVTEPDATIEFTDTQGTPLQPAGEPEPSDTGTLYRFNFSEAGTHEVLARSTDQAGNISDPSETLAFEVLTTAPAVEEFTAPEQITFYKPGDTLQAQVKLDQKVQLTESEQLKLTLQLDGNNKVEAGFDSLSGDGKTLTFNYTVKSGDNASNGLTIPPNALTGSAHIKGLSGIELAPLAGENSIPTQVIDSAAPEVPVITHLSVNSIETTSFSTNKSSFDLVGQAEAGSRIQLYNADNNEEIGEPVVTLDHGKWWAEFTTSATESSTMKVYAVTVDPAGNKSNQSTVTTVTCDPVKPEIESISGAESAKEFFIGDEVTVSVTFSKPVYVSGEPKLNLLVGDNLVQAELDKSSLDKSSIGSDRLSFKYAVTTDSPVSGALSVATNALEFAEGESIIDEFKNSATGEIGQPHALQDSINTSPVITGVTSQEAEGVYTTGNTLSFRVEFNKPITLSNRDIKLSIQLDGETISVPLAESATLENTDNLVFEYIVAADQNAQNGVTITGLEMGSTTITDAINQAHSDTSLNQSFDAHRIDTQAPSLQSLGLAEHTAKVLDKGQSLTVVLLFNEPVKVTAGDNSQLPQMTLSIGSQERVLELPASTEAKTGYGLTYTVAAEDSGQLSLSALNLNGARITDAAGLEANLSACTPADITTYQVDNTAAVIQEVTLAPGLYSTGQVLETRVTFNKAMTLNKSGGTPVLVLTIDGQPVNVALADDAELVDGKTLTFSHTLVDDQNGAVNVQGFQLRGATLTDSNTGRAFDASSYNGTPLTGVNVDTQVPSLQSLGLAEGTDAVLSTGKTLTVELRFDEPVKVIAGDDHHLPQVTLNIGDQDRVLELPASTEAQAEYSLTYTVTAEDSGQLSLTPLNLNGARITDAAGLEANLSACTPADITTYQVDNTAAVIQEVTLAPGLYSTGQVLETRVTFNKAMTLNKSGGTPVLVLTIDGQPVNVALADDAELVDGKTLTFSHTLVDDQNGAVNVQGFQLRGATLTDSNTGRAFDASSYNGTPLTGVNVDTQVPSLQSLGLAEGTDAVLSTGKTLTVELRFDEPVKVIAGDDHHLPQVTLNIGDQDRVLELPASTEAQAEYSLTYTVTAEDSGQLSLTPLNLNGARITDAAGLEANLSACTPADITTYQVDNTAAVIQEVTLAPGLYSTGQVLETRVTFNKAMTLNKSGGTPVLVLTIDGQPVNVALADDAELVDGKTLTFSHTLVDDQNGAVNVQGFQLRGATLTDSNTGRAFDASSYNGTPLTGVNVDTQVPSLQSLGLAEGTDAVLSTGKTLTVELRFDEPVKVIAGDDHHLPQVTLNIGDQDRVLELPASTEAQAEYSLTYTVTENDSGQLSLNPLNLNGAHITDAAGLEANLSDCTPADITAYKVDNTAAVIQDVTLEPGLYSTGQVLETRVTFNKAMTLNKSGGTPVLVLTIDGQPVNVALADDAELVDGKTLTFSHTLVDDQNGAVNVQGFQLRGATLTDSNTGRAFDASSYNGTPLTGVNVDTQVPSLQSLGLAEGTDAVLSTGKTLTVELRFDEPVKVIAGDDHHLPQVTLNIGDQDRVLELPASTEAQAEYSLTYTVTAEDSGQLSLTPLNLNGARITDAAGLEANISTCTPADITTYKVDNTAAVIQDVTLEPGLYSTGQVLETKVTFNKAMTLNKSGGTPVLVLTIDGQPVNVALADDAELVDGKTLTFSHTLVDDQNGAVNVQGFQLRGATLTDSNTGRAFDASSYSGTPLTGVNVDTQVPSLQSLGLAEGTDAVLSTGKTLTVELRFDEPVKIIAGDSNQLPQMTLSIGSQERVLELPASTEAKTGYSLTYTVTENDSGQLSLNALNLNGARITDAAGLEANLSACTPADITTYQVDNTAAVIQEVTLAPGLYSTGQVLETKVTFNKAMTLNKSGGTPVLVLTIDGQPVNVALADDAELVDGKTLTFSHTLVDDQNGAVNVQGFQLRGATLTDSNTGRAFDASSYSGTPLTGVNVDTQVPSLQSLGLAEGTDAVLSTGKTLTVELRFDEPVKIIAGDSNQLPQVTLDIGGQDRVLTLSATDNAQAEHSLTYTVAAEDSGQLSLSALNLNGARITDAAGLEANLSACTPADITTYQVDNTAAVIQEVTLAPGLYSTGQVLETRVTFNKAMTLNKSGGTPVLVLTIDGQPVNVALADDAELVDGKTLTFSHTLVDDQNGAVNVQGFQLRGATLTDSNTGRAFDASSYNGTPLTGVNVDTQVPSLQSLGLAEGTDAVLSTGKTLTVELRFDEPVKVIAGDDNHLPQVTLNIGDQDRVLELPASTEAKTGYGLTYTVTENDSGQLSLNPLNLNGAHITDAAGLEANLSDCTPADITAYKVDNTAAVIQDVTLEPGLYSTGQVLETRVTFNKAMTLNKSGGTPVLVLTIDGQPVNVALADDAELVDGKTLTFSHTLVDDQNGAVNVQGFQLRGATLTDSNTGRAFDASSYNGTPLTGVNVDTQVPSLQSLGLAEGTDAVLSTGKTLTVELRFDEPVKVIAGDDHHLPQVTLNIGDQDRVLELPASTEAQAEYSLTYTVTAEDSGQLSLTPLNLNGARITDAAGLEANLSACTPADITTYQVDNTAAVIQEVTLAPGLYSTGQVLETRVTFNKAMTLNKSGGTPVLVLTIDGQPVNVALADDAELVDGKTLTFSHTLVDDQNGAVNVQGFQLRGATLTDSNTGRAFDASSYNGTPLTGVNVDTQVPSLQSLGLAEGTDAVLSTGKTLTVELRFDEPVKVIAGDDHHLPQVTLNIGDQDRVLELPASTEAQAEYSLTYTVTAEDSGQLSLTPLNLNGARITDAAGLEANLSACTPADITAYGVQVTPPEQADHGPIRITNIENIDGVNNYKSGDIVSVKITFSDPVKLTKGVKLIAVIGDPQSTTPVTKFMTCNGRCSKASSEFKFSMKVEERFETDKGFLLFKFHSSAAELISSPNGKEIDLSLPKGDDTYRFSGITFNMEKGSDGQTLDQPADQTPETPALTAPSVTVDRQGATYKAGEQIAVKLSFEQALNVTKGQSPAVAQLQIGTKQVDAVLNTVDGASSELEFTYTVPAGLIDQDGIELIGVIPGDTSLTEPNSNQAFDLSSVASKNLGVSVDSVQPKIVAIVPEQSDQSRYFPGEKLAIEVRLSKPVHIASSPNAQKPYLELEFEQGKPTVKAFLDESASQAKTFIFTYNITEDSPLAIRGVVVSAINLNGASIEDSVGNSVAVEGISSNPLNAFVMSHYPSLVSTDSNEFVVVNGGAPTVEVKVPDGVDDIYCYHLKDFSSQWDDAADSTEPKVLNVKGKTHLKFDLYKGNVPKWLFTYKCTIDTADEVEMTQLYKVGNLMPTHHYNFDGVWAKDSSSHTVPSMSYTSASGITNAIVKSSAEGDIAQVRSPFSTGYALQLNGGNLRVDDMSKVFKGDFTVCSWVQTNSTGAHVPWLSPSLIGKENPKSTNDMYLFTINSEGHTGIALGNRYGAMTSQPINDGEARYICISRDLTADADGTISATQIYVNGIADGPAVNVHHKGHTSLANDPNSYWAPEAELTIDLDVIGKTTIHNAPEVSATPFAGVIDDIEISSFAMNNQQVADAYTQHLHMPMSSNSDYDSFGLYAVTSAPLLTSSSQVSVSFSHVRKAEITTDSSGKQRVILHEVEDDSVQFECQVKGVTDTYQMNSSIELNNPDLNTFQGLRCKPTDTDVVSYQVSLDDSARGNAAEALLLIGNSKGSGLYFDGYVHHGLIQSGNSPLEPKPTSDYFEAERSAVLNNVGPEDLVILDNMPEMRQLLGKDSSTEVASVLNELIDCQHSVVKPLAGGETSEGGSSVSLTVNTVAPDQPVTAYLGGDLYTINPDHHIV